MVWDGKSLVVIFAAGVADIPLPLAVIKASGCSAGFAGDGRNVYRITCQAPLADCAPVAAAMTPPLCNETLSQWLVETASGASLVLECPLVGSGCKLVLGSSSALEMSCRSGACVPAIPPPQVPAVPAPSIVGKANVVSGAALALIGYLIGLGLLVSCIRRATTMYVETSSSGKDADRTSERMPLLSSSIQEVEGEEAADDALVRFLSLPVVMRAAGRAGRAAARTPGDGPVLAFSGVGFAIRGRPVLDSVNGTVGAGSVLGILGASGSGKTTLLSFLSGRPLDERFGEVSESAAVVLAGESVPCESGARCDALSHAVTAVLDGSAQPALLTVYERGPNADELHELVMAVLEVFALGEVAHVYANGSAAPMPSAAAADGRPAVVGADRCSLACGPASALSGGERKRLALALGVLRVVARPEAARVFLCDEPTSGLDSALALQVARVLRGLARVLQLAVVVTLHQPSQRLLAAGIDSLLVLTEAGRAVVSGTLSACLAAYRAAGCDAGDECAEPGDFLIRKCRQRRLPSRGGVGGTVARAGRAGDAGLAVFGLELGVALQRQALFWLRSPWMLTMQLGVTLGACGLLSGIFYAMPLDLVGAQNRCGLLFFVLALNALTSLGAIRTFSRELALVLYERRGAWFRYPSVSYCAKVMLDVVLPGLLHPLLYGLCVYPWVGLEPTVGSLARFVGLLVGFNWMNGALALVLGMLLVSSPAAANLVVLVVSLFSMLFSGFLVSSASLATGFEPVAALSSYKYALEALLVNELGQREIDYNPVGFPGKVRSGEVILAELGMKNSQSQIRNDTAVLFAMAATLAVIGYAVFRLRLR
ncbi:ABC-type cobalamin [Thecamonas trahens ATCC 50062]|uniref:ABC-type cobalamin n=1 Tax=Thecamonas trahens ATCC 50062 TaxID=461836 RepID=A0A0L0DQH3_THETB|nr:ABC-type cobalamin [Thecamonas trahens ATCC 50062]KNC54276.1 ABC-type cobalamin [Thecamonas trahens ATCC 50062]|eukprot:XP_013753908.1 ABC-type cobalamin [Thecamonas trahens ATCC 50062]